MIEVQHYASLYKKFSTQGLSTGWFPVSYVATVTNFKYFILHDKLDNNNYKYLRYIDPDVGTKWK